MILETRAAGPFFKNGYVVGCGETSEGVLVDPGDEVDQLIGAAMAARLQIKYILLTHAHLDHITGVGRAKKAFGAPVGLHEADLVLYREVVRQGKAFGLEVEPQPPVDFFYDLGAILTFGRYEVRVRHTPGHCPGGVCLDVRRAGDAAATLFVGDTLFAGSIGRTDLWGGDSATLFRSIREVLFGYPDETPVYPGHGAPTTIGRERTGNPFVGQ